MKVKSTLISNRPFLLALVDPEKCKADSDIELMAEKLAGVKVDAVLVGGSSNITAPSLNRVFAVLRHRIHVPLVSFLLQSSEVTPEADAALVPLVLNTRRSWYGLDNFLSCLDNVLEYGIELIKLAYLVQPGETTVSYLVDPYEIPTKPKLLRRYARFINSLNFDFAYLEAGSGAPAIISPTIVTRLREHANVPLIVGGGITSTNDADVLLRSGADGLVIGTLMELGDLDGFQAIVKRVKGAH